jgi:serine protease AprX
VQATQAWSANPPLYGTGVGIAVLDSGLDSGHKDMWGSSFNSPNSRVVYQGKMIQQSSGGSTDDYGHGTWVSGIAAGRGWGWATQGTEGLYVGIAPNANLIELKVTDNSGEAHTSDVIDALQWVTDNQATYNIRVVNLSLVSSVAESYTTSALDAAVELAWLKGVVVVVSAGNGGPNTALYAPANDPYVITDGGTDDLGTAATSDDRLASWSSYGTTQDGITKPDLVAPGRHLVGPLAAGNVTLASQYPANILSGIHNLYIQLSGTSAAAPVVTGVVADLLQKRPSLRPDEVKGLLQQTALPIVGGGTGAGYPQIMSAANFTGTISRANGGLVPNSYVAQAGCQTLPAGTDCSQANWNSVSWNSVSWNSVSWNSVSWNSVSWNSVSWNSVSWNSVPN